MSFTTVVFGLLFLVILIAVLARVTRLRILHWIALIIGLIPTGFLLITPPMRLVGVIVFAALCGYALILLR